MERVVSLSVIAAAVALGQPLQAQNADSYRFDIGVHAGMSGYLGDASQSNLYSHPGFAGGVSGRYIFDDRWSVRGRIGMQTLSGNTADMDDALPGGQNLKFSSTVYDATLTAEFNFFAYGIGQPFRRLKR